MSTSTITARAPAGAWSVDRTHSRVEFEVEHNGISTFRGSFRDYDARLVIGADGLGVEGAARVASVDVDDEDLEAHLLSPEFFDAERHPEIRFRSTGYELGDDGALEVTGELTVRGATERIIARGRLGEQIADAFGSDRITVELSTTVDRHRFGLDWNMELPSGGKVLGDEVLLRVVLELVADTG
jgi:polyisoprenoid-binding protein YceI